MSYAPLIAKFVSVRVERYPFDDGPAFPPEINGAILVPGIGGGWMHHYFLVDFSGRIVTCWTVDLSRLRDDLCARFEGRVSAIPWNQETLAQFLEVIHFPHSAAKWGDWIYVTFIEGCFMLALHPSSGRYEVIFDENAGPDTIYSSTNQIRDGRIYFTRWSLEDTFSHEANRDFPVTLQLGFFEIATGRFEIVDVISGPDDIHTTAVSADGSTLILVEMSQDLASLCPRDHEFERLPDTAKRTMYEAGIRPSELITYDRRTRRVHRQLVPNGPAHIEWDPVDEDVFYLSSHNLITNNNTLYCFGNSRIDSYRLIDGKAVPQRAYESEDLLRAPSHRIVRYNGKSLATMPVFPNQMHIADLESMSLYKKINLGRRDPGKPDFSGGPLRYPPSSEDKTPYSIDTVDGTSYVYLSSLWNITVFDFESARKLGSVIYNRDKQIMLMGHASKFDFA